MIDAARKAGISDIKLAVRALCNSFGENYWRELDSERGYPTEFVRELTGTGNSE